MDQQREEDFDIKAREDSKNGFPPQAEAVGKGPTSLESWNRYMMSEKYEAL